jgi:hypothetical protein
VVKEDRNGVFLDCGELWLRLRLRYAELGERKLVDPVADGRVRGIRNESFDDDDDDDDAADEMESVGVSGVVV